MFQNKIRKATTTMVIALTLVGAAASTADATKRGQNRPNAAAKRQLCADLKLIMETNQDEAKAQWEAGNAAAASEADANATQAYNDARRQGCGWAARVAPGDWDLAVSQAPPAVGIAG